MHGSYYAITKNGFSPAGPDLDIRPGTAFICTTLVYWQDKEYITIRIIIRFTDFYAEAEQKDAILHNTMNEIGLLRYNGSYLSPCSYS